MLCKSYLNKRESWSSIKSISIDETSKHDYNVHGSSLETKWAKENKKKWGEPSGCPKMVTHPPLFLWDELKPSLFLST